jgi:hypothetical protein
VTCRYYEPPNIDGSAASSKHPNLDLKAMVISYIVPDAILHEAFPRISPDLRGPISFASRFGPFTSLGHNGYRSALARRGHAVLNFDPMNIAARWDDIDQPYLSRRKVVLGMTGDNQGVRSHNQSSSASLGGGNPECLAKDDPPLSLLEVARASLSM